MKDSLLLAGQYIVCLASITVLAYLLSTVYVNWRAQTYAKELTGKDSAVCAVDNRAAICVTSNGLEVQQLVVSCTRKSFDYFECE